MTSNKDTFELAEQIIKILDKKKAADIEALRVDDLTILTDYFIFATGNSNTQVKALADEVEYQLSQQGIEPHHVEGRASTWILLDYGSIIVNVFYKDARDFYQLEHLWADGKPVDISAITESED